MKEFKPTSSGVAFKVHVHAGKPGFKVKGFSEWLKSLEVELQSPPVKGRANKELEKKLSEFFQADCKITSGFESKNKTVIAKTTLEKISQRAGKLQR